MEIHIQNPSNLIQIAKNPFFNFNSLEENHILIDALEASSYELRDLMEKTSGVWEGYTLAQHTSMVLNQFDTYFFDNFHSSLISKELFKIGILFHDIGKSLAAESRIGKSAQYKFTKELLVEIIPIFNLEKIVKEIWMILGTKDFLGPFFRERISNENTIKNITEAAEVLGISYNQILYLIKVYYLCDGSSYSKDAGGIDSSFVYLFNFNRKKRKLTFSRIGEEKLKLLNK